jgi:hypothetical protein
VGVLGKRLHVVRADVLGAQVPFAAIKIFTRTSPNAEICELQAESAEAAIKRAIRGTRH